MTDSLSAVQLTARLQLGDGARVMLHAYSETAPILSLGSLVGGSVTVTASHNYLTPAADLAFARQLAEVAPRYLRAMEEHVARLMAADKPDRNGEA